MKALMTKRHFSSPELVTGITFNPANAQNLYLATRNGLFTSSDAGVSWSKLSDAGLTSSDVQFILASRRDSHLLYAATTRGVFEFSNNLDQWRQLYQGITSSNVRSLALDSGGNSLWAAAKGGVFRIDLDTSQKLSPSPVASSSAKNILDHFANEPTIGEIQEVAIRYAEVHPEKIEEWRKLAAKRAMLPDLKIGLDRDKTISDYFYTGSETGLDDVTLGRDWDVTLTWELGDLIWNPSQTSIDTRSKLMVQLRDDILDEVTRLYFERRRVQVELQVSPPNEIKEQVEKELRLQELTADIDALTGGYLSEQLSKSGE